jgi:hypothetical protein
VRRLKGSEEHRKPVCCLGNRRGAVAASTGRDGGWAGPDGRLGAQLVSSLARRPAASRNGPPGPTFAEHQRAPGFTGVGFFSDRPKRRCDARAWRLPGARRRWRSLSAPDASRSCDQVFRVPQLLLRPSAPGVRQRDGTSDRHALQRRFTTVNRDLPDLTRPGAGCGLTISRPRTSWRHRCLALSAGDYGHGLISTTWSAN